jgi:3'(2'), 5'-bisphosphate nucleotidase
VDLERELAVAEQLARAAGALALRYYGGDVAVEWKGADGVEGPVTRADREANDLIVAGLHDAFPDDGLLSEEIPDDGSWRRAARVWMVDPLDGTRDFIRGRTGWAVMIGLCVAERPALGVVFQPTRGQLYRAAPGRAAERVDADGRAEAIHVSSVAALPAIRLVASASHRTEAIDRVREALGVSDELNVGSVGLKLGLIAQGERDLYVNPASRSSLWDSAGPEAILVAAGGRITDLAGAPLDYSGRASLKNARGLVASNGLVHDAVMEHLRRLFPDGRPEI